MDHEASCGDGWWEAKSGLSCPACSILVLLNIGAHCARAVSPLSEDSGGRKNWRGDGFRLGQEVKGSAVSPVHEWEGPPERARGGEGSSALGNVRTSGSGGTGGRPRGTTSRPPGRKNAGQRKEQRRPARVPRKSTKEEARAGSANGLRLTRKIEAVGNYIAALPPHPNVYTGRNAPSEARTGPSAL